MKEKKGGSILGVILLVLLILLIVALIVLYKGRSSPAPAAAPTPAPLPTPTPTVVVETVEKVVEKVVEVQAEITESEIRAGLEDMGKMTTAEYWFTGVASAEKPPASILGLELTFTGSSFHASYDGCVTAGIDFWKITVKKNEEKKQITVVLPPAEILSAHIDLSSFRLLLEQSSILSHITPEDFNTSQVELEEKARQDALDRGITEKAEETARLLVERFIRGLVGPEYTVRFE